MTGFNSFVFLSSAYVPSFFSLLTQFSVDATREMVESWTDLQPAFPYASTFIAIEGFKIIGTELYRNVGLAIACVGVIVLITVANFWVSTYSFSLEQTFLYISHHLIP